MTPKRLYLRCLRWGLATGAVAGAGTAAFVGFVAAGTLGDGTLGARLSLAFGSALYGVVIGTLVAVVPTALGGLLVVETVQRHHPQPSSREAVERDLGMLFLAIVAFLAASVLLSTYVGGEGMSSVREYVPVVGVAAACTALMLWRARTSIGRGWAEG